MKDKSLEQLPKLTYDFIFIGLISVCTFHFVFIGQTNFFNLFQYFEIGDSSLCLQTKPSIYILHGHFMATFSFCLSVSNGSIDNTSLKYCKHRERHSDRVKDARQIFLFFKLNFIYL